MDKRFQEREKDGIPRESGGFPQGKAFSTESYPQVWITLGISPIYGAGENGGGCGYLESEVRSLKSGAVG